MCEIIHRYCPQAGLVLDTSSILLAAMLLNRCCHVNDRDDDCLLMGVSRAKQFLMYLISEAGSKFPKVYMQAPGRAKYNATNYYVAFKKFLNKNYDENLNGQHVPVTNEPFGFPKRPEDVKKRHESEGLLVQVSPNLPTDEEFNQGCFAIKNFLKGEKVADAWGKYVTKLNTKEQDKEGVRAYLLADSTHRKKTPYLKLDLDRSAAGKINDPTMSKSTKDKFKPNVYTLETRQVAKQKYGNQS
jgi:hypothetical protein